MKHHANNTHSFFISIIFGFFLITGVASARPFEVARSSGGCAQAQQILDEFRNNPDALNTADQFNLDAPLGEQKFQVRWLDISLPAGAEKIDPEDDEPDTITKTLHQELSNQTHMTLAMAEHIPAMDNIDPEDDEPDTTPKSFAATASRLTSVEMILFENPDGSKRGLEGCVIWNSSSTNNIDPEDDEPDTTPKTRFPVSNSWLRFSLPPHTALDDQETQRLGRKNIFWWVLGLVEITAVR